jgi:hypothetical protein
MPVQLIDTDLGYAALRKRLQAADGLVVAVGLLEPGQAIKGALNEVGTSTIPARPWLSVAVDANDSQISTKMGDAVGAVSDGAPARAAFGRLGDFVADLARQVILGQQVGGPALAQATVDRKGNSDKLIDSGDMVDAIESEVR